MSEKQGAYETIMARVPEVKWAMPDERPDHADLARRDEMLDQKLRTAARFVWLRMIGWDEPLEPTDEWLAVETDELRRCLEGETDLSLLHVFPDLGRSLDTRLYVLRVLGVFQSYASSSARVERPTSAADVSNFDPMEVR